MSGRVTWKGDDVRRDANAAAALALTRLGIGIVSEALPNTKIITGTLRRSLHVKEPGADHSGDFAAASGGTELHASQDASGIAGKGATTGKRIIVQVGSWLKYALKVELRNPYLMPAFEASKRNLPGLLKVAWGEVTGGRR